MVRVMSRFVCRVFGHRRAYPWFFIDYWICRRCFKNDGKLKDEVDKVLASASFAEAMRKGKGKSPSFYVPAPEGK